MLRTTPFAGALVGPAAGDGDGFRSRRGGGKHRGAGSFIEHGRTLKVREELADLFHGLATAESAIGHDAQEQVGQSLFPGGGIDQLHIAQGACHPGGAALLGLSSLLVDEGDDIFGQIQGHNHGDLSFNVVLPYCVTRLPCKRGVTKSCVTCPLEAQKLIIMNSPAG